MPSKKRKFGDIGEKIAEKWLKNKGFSVVRVKKLDFLFHI